MNTKGLSLRNSLLIPVLLVFVLTACGGAPDSIEIELADLPVYPNATLGEGMAQFSAGPMGGSMQQYMTMDAYDEVVEFYTDALSTYPTETISQPSQLGRQTAISVLKEQGVVSVAIQEFSAEQAVHITFMQVGN